MPRMRGRARKVFHPVGIIFKGSGFHVTDYPSKGRKKAETSESGKDKAPAKSGAKNDKS